MTDIDLLVLARGIALGAHAGQADKAGLPYITHPQRVALAVTTVDQKILAWLHDVLEDTVLQPDDLVYAGFPPHIVHQVIALTHDPGEPRVTYYRRIVGWPDARIVKLADVADNSDPRRLAYLDEATQERLLRKYAQALQILNEG